MSYLLLAVAGAAIGAALAWRVWPSRAAMRVGIAVLGGALGAGLGILQPNLFLAENGMLVAATSYVILGAVVGLLIGSAFARAGAASRS